MGKSFYSLGRQEEALTEFNKVLLLDPENKVAKEYIRKIFNENSSEPISVSAIEPIPEYSKDVLIVQASKLALSKEEAMDQELAKVNQQQDLISKEEAVGRGLKAGPLKITGEMQLGFGITPDDFIWKRANFDLNEKFFSWRMLSSAGYNQGINTYDPAVYDSLSVNLDTENKTGFNFHTNITVDPWSFTGKGSKATVANGLGDTADIQMLYWSNTGYTLNQTYYGMLNGSTLNLPEIKVVDGRTVATTASGYTILATDIDMQFQPVRELWLDYTNDLVKFRVFPMAYQNQAYTSDDPLNISNHGIWWNESNW